MGEDARRVKLVDGDAKPSASIFVKLEVKCGLYAGNYCFLLCIRIRQIELREMAWSAGSAVRRVENRNCIVHASRPS